MDKSNAITNPMAELAWKRKMAKRGKHRKVRLEAVADMANLALAVKESRRHKDRNKGVRIYDRHADENLDSLQTAIMGRTYHTSEGHDCMRRCPCGKVRKLHKLPYYPDHIMHHALMQVLMPTLRKALYIESGASVKGRGMMYAKNRTERWIDEHKNAGRIYYVKLDFVKFYENIDQERIYACLWKTFGNEGIRYLLHEVVTACDKGLGIGLYPVQTLTNHYMGYLCRKICGDHDVKVEIYCDDIVVMGVDKHEVWNAVNAIRQYAKNEMRQPLHDGIGMQIIDETHFLDFVGFRFYFGHTLLRKKMKERFKRAVTIKDEMRRYRALTSYKGWMMHCNGFNLWRRITGMNNFGDFDMPDFENRDADGKRIFDGQRVSASFFAGRQIVFIDVEFDVHSKVHKSGYCTVVSVEENGRRYKFFTNNKRLTDQLRWCRDNGKFPFTGTMRQVNTGGNPDFRITA